MLSSVTVNSYVMLSSVTVNSYVMLSSVTVNSYVFSCFLYRLMKPWYDPKHVGDSVKLNSKMYLS